MGKPDSWFALIFLAYSYAAICQENHAIISFEKLSKSNIPYTVKIFVQLDICLEYLNVDQKKTRAAGQKSVKLSRLNSYQSYFHVC
jgi:hypothetical protein